MPRGRPFPKGVIQRPQGGRPKTKKEINEFKKLTFEDFINKLQEFGALSKKDLRKIVESETTTVFDSIFSKVLHEATRGNLKAVDIIFTRLWGKVKEVDPILTPTLDGPQVQIVLPDNLRDKILDIKAGS